MLDLGPMATSQCNVMPRLIAARMLNRLPYAHCGPNVVGCSLHQSNCACSLDSPQFIPQGLTQGLHCCFGRTCTCITRVLRKGR